MAIQSSINSMLGTVAGAVVAGAKLSDDAQVSDQANQRALKIADARRRKRQLYGIDPYKVIAGSTTQTKVEAEEGHGITMDAPKAKGTVSNIDVGYSTPERTATLNMNKGRQ